MAYIKSEIIRSVAWGNTCSIPAVFFTSDTAWITRWERRSRKKGKQQVMVSVTGFFLLLNPHVLKSVYFFVQVVIVEKFSPVNVLAVAGQSVVPN